MFSQFFSLLGVVVSRYLNLLYQNYIVFELCGGFIFEGYCYVVYEDVVVYQVVVESVILVELIVINWEVVDFKDMFFLLVVNLEFIDLFYLIIVLNIENVIDIIFIWRKDIGQVYVLVLVYNDVDLVFCYVVIDILYYY